MLTHYIHHWRTCSKVKDAIDFLGAVLHQAEYCILDWLHILLENVGLNYRLISWNSEEVNLGISVIGHCKAVTVIDFLEFHWVLEFAEPQAVYWYYSVGSRLHWILLRAYIRLQWVCIKVVSCIASGLLKKKTCVKEYHEWFTMLSLYAEYYLPAWHLFLRSPLVSFHPNSACLILNSCQR